MCHWICQVLHIVLERQRNKHKKKLRKRQIYRLKFLDRKKITNQQLEKNAGMLLCIHMISVLCTGVKEAPEEYNNEVLDMLKEHTQNKDKEQRIRQPDLPLQ